MPPPKYSVLGNKQQQGWRLSVNIRRFLSHTTLDRVHGVMDVIYLLYLSPSFVGSWSSKKKTFPPQLGVSKKILRSVPLRTPVGLHQALHDGVLNRLIVWQFYQHILSCLRARSAGVPEKGVASAVKLWSTDPTAFSAFYLFLSAACLAHLLPNMKNSIFKYSKKWGLRSIEV